MSSRKGTLSLIIIACITYLCAVGKLDGTSYAVVMGVVQLIFCWIHSKTDQLSMKINDPNQLCNDNQRSLYGIATTGIDIVKTKVGEALNKPII